MLNPTCFGCYRGIFLVTGVNDLSAGDLPELLLNPPCFLKKSPDFSHLFLRFRFKKNLSSSFFILEKKFVNSSFEIHFQRVCGTVFVFSKKENTNITCTADIWHRMFPLLNRMSNTGAEPPKKNPSIL